MGKMNKMLNNNKGVVLIASYLVLVTLLALSAVSFMRSINQSLCRRYLLWKYCQLPVYWYPGEYTKQSFR